MQLLPGQRETPAMKFLRRLTTLGQQRGNRYAAGVAVFDKPVGQRRYGTLVASMDGVEKVAHLEFVEVAASKFAFKLRRLERSRSMAFFAPGARSDRLAGSFIKSQARPTKLL